MIVFEMGHDQADALIRDIARSIALLHVAHGESACPYHRRACLHHSRRLADFARELEERLLMRAGQ